MPVNIIDTLKPKNGGNFKIVEAIDVFVEGYSSLADAVSHFATDVMIEAINVVLSSKANASDLTALSAVVNTKADSSDLTALTSVVNGKANTLDVNTATANLQSQIDALITPVTQDAEVQNARIDTEGDTQTTLKERLDADYSRNKNDIIRLSTGLDADTIPLVNDFKNELLSYTSGGIPEQYIGQGVAWTDEKFYLIEDISSVVVPEGYKAIVAMYSTDAVSGFVTGFEGTGTFNLASYGYKYARFCIRKQNNAALTLDNAKAAKIICKNRISKSKIKSSQAHQLYNNYIAGNSSVLIPELKEGRITSSGVTDSHGARYYDLYLETARVSSVQVPDGYYVSIYYYDAAYEYKTMASYQADFEPLTRYAYCRLMLHKTADFKPFNDDLTVINSFTVSLKEVISPLSYGDICPKLAAGTESTYGGITYTSDGESIKAEGTCASGGSFVNVYYNENGLPTNFKLGRRYYLEFNGLPSRANIAVTHKTTEGWQTTNRLVPLTYKQAYFTIPYDAIGFRITISINQGFTYNEVFTPRIYDVESLAYAQRVKNKACKPMLTIVYDDGLTQFKDYILPIIQSKKVPIATSIIVSAIEEENPRVMTYADVKECYEKGAEVLVHSKERTEQEWGNSSDVIAYELRTAKHILESKCCPVPNCYIYSAQSSMYPACRHAAEKEFSIAVASGSQGTKAANDGVTNYYGDIDPYYVERRWADGNWLTEEDCETVLKSWIDELAASKTGWQIWTRHNYPEEDESANAATLATVIDYALTNGIEIVTMAKGMSEYGLM